VADPNLGSDFGVTVRDDEEQVRAVADRFRAAAAKHLC
jgi:hypothetical protein